jgi:hypothetical protein
VTDEGFRDGVEDDATTEESSTPLSLDDAIGLAFEGGAEEVTEEAPKSSRERNSDGTFKRKEETSSLEEAPSETPLETKEAAPEVEVVTPPVSWTLEEKERFKTLPVETQKYLAQREGQREKAWHEANARAKRLADIEDAFSPYSEELALSGLTPGQVVRQMIAERQIMRRDPLQAARQLLQASGKSLSDLESHEESYDPKYKALEDEVNRLKSVYEGQQQYAQEAQVAEVENEITRFSSEVDQKGQPLRPYFNDVYSDMLPIAQMLKAQNPNAHPRVILEQAYERAAYANPQVRTILLEKERQALQAKHVEEARQKAQAAKAAGSSISGAPGGSISREVSRDLDSLISNIWDGRL